MKKYFGSLIAVAIAIVCFAFTGPNFSEGIGCATETLYWFQVDPSLPNQECSQIIQSELIAVQDANNNNSPDEVEFLHANDSPFGCADEEFACALGYSLSQLERVQVGTNFVYRPKVDQVQSFRCCIYKPVQP